MYKVIDTNIILLDAQNLLELGSSGDIIIIPETVVDEVDNKKSQLSEIGYQARQFGRIMSEAKVILVTHADIEQTGTPDVVEVHCSVRDILVIVVSKKRYRVPHDIDSSIYNDRKIIEIAVDMTSRYGKDNVIFMSNDVMCRTRALADGLNVDTFATVEATKHEFNKEVYVEDPEIFRNAHNRPIKDIDPDYHISNKNYTLRCVTTGDHKLGIIVHGRFSVLSKQYESELARQNVSPINSGQKFLSMAIQEPAIDVVVVDAAAGSGKSVVAISNAMRLMDTKPYTGILYVRNSVQDLEKNEELGFLKGDMSDKTGVFFTPLQDVLYFIAKNKLSNSKLRGKELEQAILEKVDALVGEYHIESLITLGMRGRTFSDKIIIIDECQSMSPAGMQKVLTRIGKNCKVILIGSQNQIDNSYLTRYTNGLAIMLEACSQELESTVVLHPVQMPKTVRSPLTELAEQLFTTQH